MATQALIVKVSGEDGASMDLVVGPVEVETKQQFTPLMKIHSAISFRVSGIAFDMNQAEYKAMVEFINDALRTRTEALERELSAPPY